MRDILSVVPRVAALAGVATLAPNPPLPAADVTAVAKMPVHQGR